MCILLSLSQRYSQKYETDCRKNTFSMLINISCIVQSIHRFIDNFDNYSFIKIMNKPKLLHLFSKGKPETLVCLSDPEDLLNLLFIEGQTDLICIGDEKDKQFSESIFTVNLHLKIFHKHIIVWPTLEFFKNQVQQARMAQKIILICPRQMKQNILSMEVSKRVSQIYYFDFQSNSNKISQTDLQILIQRLQCDIAKNKKNRVLPNFLFIEEQSLESHQSLRTMLTMLNQSDDQQTKDMLIDQLTGLLKKMSDHEKLKDPYKYKNPERDIKEFVQYLKRDYSMEQTFQWYTDQTFIYEIVNKLLRSFKTPFHIFYIQPFFKNLHRAIKDLHVKQLDDNKKINIKCFRGGLINNSQFNCFKRNKGKLVRNLGFLSTSKNWGIARRFQKNVLFQIEIDEEHSELYQNYGYADLSQKSNYRIQEQVLFNNFSFFNVIDALSLQEQNNQNSSYIIKLKYLSKELNKQAKNLEDLKALWKDEIDKNHLQGNAALNQFYNEKDGYEYWQKFLEICEQPLKPEEQQRDLLILQKAYGMFHIWFAKSAHQGVITQKDATIFSIFKGLFGQNHEIYNKLVQVFENYLHPSEFDKINKIVKQKSLTFKRASNQQVLLSSHYFRFFNGCHFDKLMNVKKKKFIINGSLNLQYYLQKKSDPNSRLGKILSINEIDKLKIKVINLRWVNLVCIPDEIYQFKLLSKAFFGFNHIKQITQKISCLQQLTFLGLTSNLIEKISPEIEKLSKIQDFSLKNNKIYDLSIDFAKFLFLKKLWIGQNMFNFLKISNQKGTQDIYVGQGKINSVPCEIGQMLNLKVLGLASNKIKTLPDAIYNLTLLVELYLQTNQLERIQSNVRSLANLQILSLAQNVLIDLPQQIGCLYEMSNLLLGRNRLRQIPSSIRYLSKLRVLSISYNMLTKVPAQMIEVKNLDIFDIVGNNLQNGSLELIQKLQVRELVHDSAHLKRKSNNSILQK